jgi:hypothetical protein
VAKVPVAGKKLMLDTGWSAGTPTLRLLSSIFPLPSELEIDYRL